MNLEETCAIDAVLYHVVKNCDFSFTIGGHASSLDTIYIISEFPSQTTQHSFYDSLFEVFWFLLNFFGYSSGFGRSSSGVTIFLPQNVNLNLQTYAIGRSVKTSFGTVLGDRFKMGVCVSYTTFSILNDYKRLNSHTYAREKMFFNIVSCIMIICSILIMYP